MSEAVLKKLEKFTTFSIDKSNRTLHNIQPNHNSNIEELLEISHILDSSYLNYNFDQNLNIIVLGKK